jgi:hypothetical protein
MANYWLIVERYANWQVDRSENFYRFGIPDKKVPLARTIRPGDILVTYISGGKSAFSDMRRVLSPPIIALKQGGPYDAAFSTAISTAPLLVLPEEHWVSVKGMLADLTFLSGKDWGQVFRTSLKALPAVDGVTIERALKAKRKVLSPSRSV